MSEHKIKRITRDELKKIIDFYYEACSILSYTNNQQLKSALIEEVIKETKNFRYVYFGDLLINKD